MEQSHASMVPVSRKQGSQRLTQGGPHVGYWAGNSCDLIATSRTAKAQEPIMLDEVCCCRRWLKLQDGCILSQSPHKGSSQYNYMVIGIAIAVGLIPSNRDEVQHAPAATHSTSQVHCNKHSDYIGRAKW